MNVQNLSLWPCAAWDRAPEAVRSGGAAVTQQEATGRGEGGRATIPVHLVLMSDRECGLASFWLSFFCLRYLLNMELFTAGCQSLAGRGTRVDRQHLLLPGGWPSF